MTNALGGRLAHKELVTSTQEDCHCDVVIPDYDGARRDLLIEAKPDPDRYSLRTAIGQLFDYRWSMPREEHTDLAVLTITPPPERYLNLLEELEISAIWFTDEGCVGWDGRGKAWTAMDKGGE